ncbi:hypothetical protein D3C73_915250 [compost metagenome]
MQVGQFEAGRDQVQVVVARFGDRHVILLAGRPAGQALLEEVGDAHGDIITGQPGQVMGGIGLGIEVHQKRPVAFGRTDRRQIAGNAGFAHPTFLIEHHSTHDNTSLKENSYIIGMKHFSNISTRRFYCIFKTVTLLRLNGIIALGS